MTELDAPPTEAGFDTLGLDPRLTAALGYDDPTPVQRQAIPPLLLGRDLVAQAATGTGKTAAFALPLLHRLAADGDRAKPSALVLVPTRELAMQVAETIRRYGKPLGAGVLAVYGGQAFEPQLAALRRGVDVVVATPGRAHDHLRRGTLPLDGIAAVVLDEADEMMEMGFAEDLEAILSATPATRQTMLFSATMSPRVAAIARKHLTDPLDVRVAKAREEAGAPPRVRHTAYVVERVHKPAALVRVLDVETPTAAIVFCRTRQDVDGLTDALRARGHRPEALHGGMSQEQRDRVMRLFRAGRASVLVATDVAARGLDIGHLTHVINYDLPPDPEAYVHRVGRVGRAGREGVAITLAEPRQRRFLRDLERAAGQRVEVLPLPTVADLRAKRLEGTAAQVRAAIAGGGLDAFRETFDALVGEHDPLEVALAALKMAYEGGASHEPEEIPTPKVERAPRHHDAAPRRNHGPRMGRIFVGVGRDAGIVPRDLVGAIANEAGVAGRDIRGIDVAERHSLVEVPEDVVEYVIDTLRGARIKGRKVFVRRDRRPGGEG